jgi:hypothetical protein
MSTTRPFEPGDRFRAQRVHGTRAPALTLSGETPAQGEARGRSIDLARTILSTSEVNVRGYEAHELANLVLDLLGPPDEDEDGDVDGDVYLIDVLGGEPETVEGGLAETAAALQARRLEWDGNRVTVFRIEDGQRVFLSDGERAILHRLLGGVR